MNPFRGYIEPKRQVVGSMYIPIYTYIQKHIYIYIYIYVRMQLCIVAYQHRVAESVGSWANRGE